MRVYFNDDIRPERVKETISDVPGVDCVLSRMDVVREYNLPAGPEGDLAVFGDLHTVIGTREVDHDLHGLKGQRLRTHGSVYEADVPFIISRPVSNEYARRAEDARLHSYETFDYVLNGITD